MASTYRPRQDSSYGMHGAAPRAAAAMAFPDYLAPRPWRPRLWPPGFPRLRDLLEHLAGQRLAPSMHGQITQCHHPDQLLVAVEDGKAPNLVLLHQTRGVLDVLIVEA